MEERFEKIKKITARIPEMQKNNPAFNRDLAKLNATLEHTITVKTSLLIDKTYSGLITSAKQGVSTETYFIEQNNAAVLKTMLANYILYIDKIMPGETNFKKQTILDLSDRETKGKMLSWEMYYFGKCSKKTAMETLRKLKNEFVLVEIKRIEYKNKKPVK
jgi:hypothetical protein